MESTQKFKKTWNLYFRFHFLGIFLLYKYQKRQHLCILECLLVKWTQTEVIFERCCRSCRAPRWWPARNDPEPLFSKTLRGLKMTCRTPGPPGETPSIPKSCSPCSIPPREAFTPWPLQTASPPQSCHSRRWWRLSEACRGSLSLYSQSSWRHPRKQRGRRYIKIQF